MNYAELCAPAYPEMHAIYQDLHRHPELGLEEHRTAALVAGHLRDSGLEVTEGVAGTGVVGVLHTGRPGKTVLLRADMDALPVGEETDLPFKSQTPGVMHACGHDGHTAMLLCAARIMAAMKDRLSGTAIFVFEPNEENAGAQAMIDTGVFSPYAIDACFALHLWSPVALGKLGLSSGGVMGGLEQFYLTIKGHAGHTGSPHLSRDPILAAADLIVAAQAIQTRQINPLSPTAIMFGHVEAGTVCNAIPQEALLEGTIRFLYKNDPDGPEHPVQRFSHTVEHVCRLHDVGYELKYFTSNSTVYNDPGLVALVRSGAEEIIGTGNIVEHRSMAGEDFSEFGQLGPSVFMFVGMGDDESGTAFPHHHPRFCIHPKALETGLQVHLSNALALMRI